MKSVKLIKKYEADLRKKYLPDLETEAGLVGLVGAQYDRVIVKVDSTKESKKTVYEHNGTAWVYVNKVENIEHEIAFTDDHNIYITDKDRKPKLMGDVLPYEDIDDLLDKDPAIYNKLYITKKGKLYYYNADGAYKLVSGGGGAGGTNRLTDVATYAEIATTYPKPDDWDCVVVTVDETHDGQTTWYMFDGNTWAYQGIYFPETVELVVSERNVRTAVIDPNVDYTIPIKYLVGKGHLEIYIEGEPLVKDVDYTEVGTSTYVSTKVQFKNTIPKEARIAFKRVVSSYIGDSMISRMSAEGWLKYATDAWTGLNTLVMSLGFDSLTKSINVDATAGAVVKTVPSNCGVGTRLLYRKIDASANGVTINMPSGETITRANLAAVTLTSQDDEWELEKVTNTRWILKSGSESGYNTTQKWKRYYTGHQEITGTNTITTVASQTAYNAVYVSLVKPFVDATYTVSMIQSATHGDMTYGNVQYGLAIIRSASDFSYSMRMSGSPIAGISVVAAIFITGRWYI